MIAIGVNAEGHREVLGLMLGDTESASIIFTIVFRYLNEHISYGAVPRSLSWTV